MSKSMTIVVIFTVQFILAIVLAFIMPYSQISQGQKNLGGCIQVGVVILTLVILKRYRKTN